MALHEAVKVGNYNRVRRLLIEGANPNELDNNGYTPLYYTIKDKQYYQPKSKHVKIARLLITYGTNVNLRAQYRWSNIKTAIYRGHHTITDLLLRNGAIVNNISDLLYEIVRSDDIKMLKHLIKYNFNIDAYYPLYYAAIHEQYEMTECLLANGATIDRSDDQLLIEVISNNDIKMLELLIRYKISVNVGVNGWSGLHSASAGNHIEAARILLDRGADVDVVDDEGNTPLSLAKSDQMIALLTSYITVMVLKEPDLD